MPDLTLPKDRSTFDVMEVQISLLLFAIVFLRQEFINKIKLRNKGMFYWRMYFYFYLHNAYVIPFEQASWTAVIRQLIWKCYKVNQKPHSAWLFNCGPGAWHLAYPGRKCGKTYHKLVSDCALSARVIYIMCEYIQRQREVHVTLDIPGPGGMEESRGWFMMRGGTGIIPQLQNYFTLKVSFNRSFSRITNKDPYSKEHGVGTKQYPSPPQNDTLPLIKEISPPTRRDESGARQNHILPDN